MIYYQTHYHLNLEACSSQLPVPEACVTSSSQVHHPSVFPAVNQFNSESVEIFRSVATTRNMRRKVQPRMVNVFLLHCLWLTAHCCLPEIFRKRMNRPCFWQKEMLQYIQYNLIPSHAKVPCCLYGPIYIYIYNSNHFYKDRTLVFYFPGWLVVLVGKIARFSIFSI